MSHVFNLHGFILRLSFNNALLQSPALSSGILATFALNSAGSLGEAETGLRARTDGNLSLWLVCATGNCCDLVSLLPQAPRKLHARQGGPQVCSSLKYLSSPAGLTVDCEATETLSHTNFVALPPLLSLGLHILHPPAGASTLSNICVLSADVALPRSHVAPRPASNVFSSFIGAQSEPYSY